MRKSQACWQKNKHTLKTVTNMLIALVWLCSKLMTDYRSRSRHGLKETVKTAGVASEQCASATIYKGEMPIYSTVNVWHDFTRQVNKKKAETALQSNLYHFMGQQRVILKHFLKKYETEAFSSNAQTTKSRNKESFVRANWKKKRPH